MSTNYELVNLSWQEYDELVFNILKQLKTKRIDYLVPILRGGAVLGLSLASNLQLPTMYMRIKRSESNQPNSDFGSPNLLGCDDLKDITDKNILICEDTIDTEKTLKFALEYLGKYKPKNIYVATLFNFSKNSSYISGKKMSEHKWIVFPWERGL